jgi:hypothetical protein
MGKVTPIHVAVLDDPLEDSVLRTVQAVKLGRHVVITISSSDDASLDEVLTELRRLLPSPTSVPAAA